MSRVTRASSRAEAEFSQNKINKADIQNLTLEIHENVNENKPAIVAEISSHEPFKAEIKKPKKANAKTKTKSAANNRQPLGDIALNAIDDGVERREKNTKEQKRSNSDKTEGERIDLSVEDETKIRVDDEEITKKEELVATEFMEPSVLEVVEEVDEDAGDKETKESSYVGKEVESLGTNIPELEKLDINSEFLQFQKESFDTGTKLENRKASMDNVNEKNKSLSLKVENESSPNALFQTVSQSPQLTKSSTTSPETSKRPEDSIEDMDAITAAIEELGEALPCLDSFNSPIKSNKSNGETTAANHSKVSKTPHGRLSIAKRVDPTTKDNNVSCTAIQNAKHTSARRSNPSAQLSSNSTKYSRNSTSNAAEKHRSSTSSTSKTVDYLASRRPSINLKFPTPPSAPKNVKPRTVSDFKLPSEELAAKYRAQREERLKKEQEEEAAKRTFRARPVPKSISAGGGNTAVGPRPTAATKARENLMREAKSDVAPAKQDENKSQIRKKIGAMETTPSAKSLEKRRSMIIASAQHEKRAVRRTSSITPLQSQTASKRNSIATANSSSTSGSNTKTAGGGGGGGVSDAATLRAKGREVFNRDRVAKEEMERERRAKEEAARKARAEAAERGRQTSREWAEKQKQKMLEAKIKARVEAAKCA